MHPPLKDQADIGLEEPTIDASSGATLLAAGEETPDNPDNRTYTRQEGKDEADINYMLSRFGIVQPRGTPTYGEWDDSLDLMTALNAVQEAREGYMTLPKELREKFPSMEAFLTAVQNGSLVLKTTDASATPTSVPEQDTPKPTA